MIKTAVIFESCPFDRKGLFNAVHNRILHLLKSGECQIDLFCIQSKDNFITRKIRHTSKIPFVDKVVIDGLEYRMLWYNFSIIDYILTEKLNIEPVFFRKFITDNLRLLEGYDCIIAHSFSGAVFAYEAGSKYGIPYTVTWHGSDIHTHPWRNPLKLRSTETVMKDASYNFFVSETLMACSERISDSARKEVLYNGVSERFRHFSVEERLTVDLEFMNSNTATWQEASDMLKREIQTLSAAWDMVFTSNNSVISKKLFKFFCT